MIVGADSRARDDTETRSGRARDDRFQRGHPRSYEAIHSRPFQSWKYGAAVYSISRVDRETIHVELDDRRLEFCGVQECQYPEPLEAGVVWMYEEMDLVDTGQFELRALFSEGDFGAIAREVHVFDKHFKRYVVPEQLALLQSTLFLDRRLGRGQRKK
jgi:Protein of unknown function (DUF4085)